MKLKWIKMLRRLLGLSRRKKQLLLLGFDICVIPVALLAAVQLKYGGFQFTPLSLLVSLSIPLFFTTVLVFARMGLYRAVTRFIGTEALWITAQATAVSAGILFMLGFAFSPKIGLSIAIVYWFTCFSAISASRLIARSLLLSMSSKARKNAAIFGAGQAGIQLLNAIKQDSGRRIVAFIDSDKKVKNTIINGVSVYDPSKIQALIDKHGLQEVFLALPAASRDQRRSILKELEPYPVHVKTVPTLNELVTGKASIEQLAELDISDLLGRDPVPPNKTLLDKNIAGKSVMVTGAGGSIGSELCRQIIRLKPRTLLLLELSEYALYSIEQELIMLKEELSVDTRIICLLGSIMDYRRVVSALKAYEIQTIYHAAAYKHVPMVEHNVVSGVRNNIIGTYTMARACMEARVERFVLVSTDKAVRPTNVMGASKRFAELVLQGLVGISTHTRFVMVRFGNVLGSSGSVVPLFRKQIESGGPVTVTHPEVIRYFMTIPEAAQLVIQAGAMARGGEVYLLDMGKPIKIADLARQMIRLMGYQVKDEQHPDGDISVTYSGLRPGEKLYEELLIGENAEKTEHPRIRRAHELSYAWAEIDRDLRQISRACEEGQCDKLRSILLNRINGYKPGAGVLDHIWAENEATTSNGVVDIYPPTDGLATLSKVPFAVHPGQIEKVANTP